MAIALDHAKLKVTAAWPVRSDGHMGHHSHPGNCEWDIVLICRPHGQVLASNLVSGAEDWIDAVKPLDVNAADRKSFRWALEMASHRMTLAREKHEDSS
jgi:hypothetical protein